METNFLSRHRRKLYFALALCIIVHALNIFVFDKYLSQFAFASFWLLLFPGFISIYLILAAVIEFLLRKGKKTTLRTLGYIFLGMLAGVVTFVFLFSAWHFGGLKYLHPNWTQKIQFGVRSELSVVSCKRVCDCLLSLSKVRYDLESYSLQTIKQGQLTSNSQSILRSIRDIS